MTESRPLQNDCTPIQTGRNRMAKQEPDAWDPILKMRFILSDGIYTRPARHVPNKTGEGRIINSD